MKFDDQGTMDNHRYTVVPRTLVFLVQRGHVLLLRGASTKRLWAGRLNGVGGHVEPNENILESAIREFEEETGLQLLDPELRGLVHVQGQGTAPGVILYVFSATQVTGELSSGEEGCLEWHALDALPLDDLVDDVARLLPLVTKTPHQMVYAHYWADEHNRMHFRFR